MISGMAITPDSKLLVTGGNDAKVCVWDIETGTLMRTLETPEPVTGVAISADGRIAASVAVSATSGKGFVWVSPEKLLDTARSLIPRDPPDYLTVAEVRRFGL
jgi:WD40 repeat protein